MPRATIKALEGNIAKVIGERDIHANNWLKERDRANAAERIRDQICKDNADLKERLLNSEKEVSRLSGYMERVREDDNVTDPLVEVDDQYGKRMVSKRHPTPIMNGGNGMDYIHDHLNSREKRRHWTSY